MISRKVLLLTSQHSDIFFSMQRVERIRRLNVQAISESIELQEGGGKGDMGNYNSFPGFLLC